MVQRWHGRGASTRDDWWRVPSSLFFTCVILVVLLGVPSLVTHGSKPSLADVRSSVSKLVAVGSNGGGTAVAEESRAAQLQDHAFSDAGASVTNAPVHARDQAAAAGIRTESAGLRDAHPRVQTTEGQDRGRGQGDDIWQCPSAPSEVPRRMIESEQWMLPLLLYGPGNQYIGLVEAASIALILNRTLVLSPFRRHHTQ